MLLVCTKCKRHVSITEKLEDAFSFGSEKYKTQKFPRTSKEKSEFLWNGIDLNDYFVETDTDEEKQKKHLIFKFEMCKLLYLTNYHDFQHFESCFKYSKEKEKE